MGIHAVRDPRQMLVSAYLHHLQSHPTETDQWVWHQLKIERDKLRKLDFEQGLICEMDGISGEALGHMSEWQPDDRVLEVRIEDAAGDRQGFVSRIATHLKVDPPNVDWSRQFSDSGASHWSNCFTPTVRDEFKQRFGDLVVALGYEHNNDW